MDLRYFAELDRNEEGFRAHFAIDGSLKEVSGNDAACGWTVAQMDHVKRKGAVVYDLCHDAGRIGSTKNQQQGRVVGFYHGSGNHDGSLGIQADNMGIIDGL